MGNETVVPSENELRNVNPGDHDVLELIRHAQESDAADRLLTVRQALSKYKKAVFWAMFLSTSLIMEGYDLVIVSSFLLHLARESQTDTRIGRSTLSMAKPNLSNASASSQARQGKR